MNIRHSDILFSPPPPPLSPSLPLPLPSSLFPSFSLFLSLSLDTAIDECSTVADCVGGASCINTGDAAGFLCQCPPGFSGDGRTSGSGYTGEWVLSLDSCMHNGQMYVVISAAFLATTCRFKYHRKVPVWQHAVHLSRVQYKMSSYHTQSKPHAVLFTPYHLFYLLTSYS